MSKPKPKPDITKNYSGGSDTSREAFESEGNKAKREADRARVLAFMRSLYERSPDPRYAGRTSESIQGALGLPHHNSGRMSELKKTGDLVVARNPDGTPMRRPTARGGKAEVLIYNPAPEPVAKLSRKDYEATIREMRAALEAVVDATPLLPFGRGVKLSETCRSAITLADELLAR